MPLHQVLGQEKISHRRDERDEQDADGGFALVEQLPNERERALEMARGERVAELENDAGARERNKGADVFPGHAALFFAEEKIELLQFALDRAPVAAGEEDEKIERLLLETQLAFPA